MNAAEALLREGRDDGVALECAGATRTRAALRDGVARMAAAWQALGLRPGEVVAIRLPDGIAWVEAWLGVLWAGGVAVGVSPRLAAADWDAMQRESGFAFVLVEAGADAAPQPGQRWLDGPALQRMQQREAPVPPRQRRADDAALWVHSSGSSGSPKAVVHAHRELADIARISRERLGLVAGDRLFASSRLFFTYALVNALLAGLKLGATVLVDPAWPTAAGVAAFVRERRATVLFSVPALYRAMLHEGQAAALRGSTLRLAVSAGEALPPTLRAAWHAASGVPMWNGWGSAETLVLALTAAADEDALHASPGVAVEPLDAQAAAAGAPVRLAVRCASVARGYHARPACEALHEGTFRGADLFVAAAGGWRFAGREDSLVKVHGRWVDLVALEEQLGAGLREAALAVAADRDGLPELHLFFGADDPDAARALLDRRVASLPPHQRPAALHALPALPRTATGKLMRRILVEQAQARAGQEASA